MDTEFQITQKESVVSYFKLLPQHFSVENYEKHESLDSLPYLLS